MSEALEAASKGVNDNGREVLRRLWQNDLMPADILRGEIEAYAAYVAEEVPKRRPFVDTELASAIGTACLALLDAVGEDAPEDQRRAVQLAGLYFVASEDDLDGAMGFDDDARVVNQVARHLGLDIHVDV